MANIYPNTDGSWTYVGVTRVSDNDFLFTADSYASAEINWLNVGELSGELQFSGNLSPSQHNLTHGIRCRLDIYLKPDELEPEWKTERHFIYLKGDINGVINQFIETNVRSFDHITLRLETAEGADLSEDDTISLTSFVINNPSNILEKARDQAEELVINEFLPAIIQGQMALQQAAANAVGMYVTEITHADESKKIYWHDEVRLIDSMLIEYYPEPGTRMSTQTGWNDGEPIWEIGQTSAGMLVMKLIQTVGLNAEWIRTGTLDAGMITVSGNTLTNAITNLQDVDAALNQQIMDYKAGGSNGILNSDFGNVQSPSATWWTEQNGTSCDLIKARFDTVDKLKNSGLTCARLLTYDW